MILLPIDLTILHFAQAGAVGRVSSSPGEESLGDVHGGTESAVDFPTLSSAQILTHKQRCFQYFLIKVGSFVKPAVGTGHFSVIGSENHSGFPAPGTLRRFFQNLPDIVIHHGNGPVVSADGFLPLPFIKMIGANGGPPLPVLIPRLSDKAVRKVLRKCYVNIVVHAIERFRIQIRKMRTYQRYSQTPRLLPVFLKKCHGPLRDFALKPVIEGIKLSIKGRIHIF